MKSNIKVIGVSALLAISLVACIGEDEPVVDQEEIKSNYVDMSYAAYSDSLDTALTLQGTVEVFVADPTEENLAAAKVAYKAARVPYQQSEIMRWDTAITLTASLDSDGGPASVDEWEGQVNAWPLDENYIVSIIEGDEDINIDLLIAQNGGDDNEANVTTGVHAVEFMLWGEDTHGVEAGAGERPASDFALDGDCADAYCARRAEYLVAASDLLIDDLTAMVAEWSPTARDTAGTLANNFLNSELALDYILGSIRSMASDELASARMSSGLELGDPEESHDCFSDLSHVAIYYNFQGVRNAFYGSYGDVSGQSLGDLIAAGDPATYDAIDEALTSIEEKMLQIFMAGERTTNTVRYDQIIGQDATGIERQIAEAAVDELIAIDVILSSAVELLSLEEIITDGSGD